MNKKRERKYNTLMLRELAKDLNEIRRPIGEDKSLVQIKVEDIYLLEKAIYMLPKKERETLEKMYGLVEGTIAKSKSLRNGHNNERDIALRNQAIRTYDAMRSLVKVDMLYVYDKCFQDLVANIVTKMEKPVNMTDMEAIKYLLIFFIFIVGGPHMLYEEEAKSVGWNEEDVGNYDMYTLLQATWESSISLMEEKNINMTLLKEVVEMFDISDVISMKRHVGLPIGKQNVYIQTTDLETFARIRKFKENLFSKGEWTVTEKLVYDSFTSKLNLKPLSDAMKYLRNSDTEKYRCEDRAIEIEVSTGKKELVLYKIGSLRFTDPYEMLSLYLCRRALKA